MKPNSNPANINEYLDTLVGEYTDLLIEQSKNLIIFESKEEYESCKDIQDYLDNVGEILAKTIFDLSGVPEIMTSEKLSAIRQSIYQQLKESFEI